MFPYCEGCVESCARARNRLARVRGAMKQLVCLGWGAVLAGCSTLVSRPEAVRASHAIPIAPAAEIVIGRSQGLLEYRGGCLFLTRDREDRRIRLLVIWPTGSRFDGRVVVPGESATPVAFALGEEVVIEGSAPEWSPYLTKTFPQLAVWQTRCGERPLFVATVRRAS